MASKTVLLAVAGLGLLGIFALAATVVNMSSSTGYVITGDDEPAIWQHVLNSSTINVNSPNLNGKYGLRILNDRMIEVRKGGFESPDFILASNKNETKDTIPSVFWLLIGSSNRINVAIEMNDGTEALYGVNASELFIEDVNIGGYENPGYTITTDENTLVELSKAKEPSKAAEDLYKDGRIKISSNDFVSNVKLFIADALFRIFG
jgi:hypothetical protein